MYCGENRGDCQVFLSEGWTRLSRSSELCSAGQKKRAQNKENICFLEPAPGLLKGGKGGKRLLISMVGVVGGGG